MLSPYTGHLLKSVKRMAGAETKENGHIFSLNSSKPKFKKMFTPRLKNLQFYYRSERHSTQSETRLLPNNAKRKTEHVESKLLTQYYQLKPACCVHQNTEGQKSGTNTVQRITEVN